MDHYDPAMVFSSIDEQGRYAYANQPRIALWNLTRLAECLLPLLADEQDKAIEEAQTALGGFAEGVQRCYQAGLRRKLGLFTARDGDPVLAHDLLDAMAKNQADFTLTFRRLSDAVLDPGGDAQVRRLFADPAAYERMGRCAGGNGSATSRQIPPPGRPRCGRQIPLHSEESQGGSGHRCAVNRDDFALFRGTSDSPVKAVRGPAGIVGLCRPAGAAPARAADVLRDVKR